ncbi:MAG: Do family serine endopeptidase [bacterium]|nr:Do family serine endopeptidase [bacterium]
MKKIGMIAGTSFLAGALFFALTFGFLQDDGSDGLVLTPATVKAQATETETTQTTQSSQTTDSPKFIGRGFSFAPVVKKVRAAVVKVTSETMVKRRRDDFLERFFNTPRSNRGRRERVSGTGSGFFISADGYILTNNHVVENAVKITVTDINNKEFPAKKIGADPKSDLALLKIKGKDHSFIELGDSDRVEVGEWILAIGNPLGQDLSVTSGIVSAKGRQLSGLEVDYQNFIQTDAAINQGNSGGPMINMDGKAVGINSAILSTSGGSIGIGFAIPSNMARKVIGDLRREGRVIRGYVGVTIRQLPESDAKDLDFPMGGVLIEKVEAGTPADSAGLKRFDLIVEVDGKRVKNSSELRTVIANHSPGDTVRLTIYREDKRKEVNVKVAEATDSLTIRSDKDNEEGRVIDLGMSLNNNSRALVRRFDLETSEGIVLVDITRGGVASEHGLRTGDVILGVNRTQIDSVRQFRRVISKKSGSRVFLTINRSGRETLVRFSIPE